MAIDLTALRAKLAAQKEAAQKAATTAPVVSTSTEVAVTSTPNTVPATAATVAVIPTVNAPAVLGTSKTTEIEHLDFLSKMNSLAQAIHTQHPTMPVLLQQIHKQLRTDPELVTTLDEDGIGIIVRGLQIQTKTELVAEAVKKTSSGRAKKNPALSTDMF